MQKYRRRLELLAAGRLVEAMQVQTGGSSATAKAVDGMQDADGERIYPTAVEGPHMQHPFACRKLTPPSGNQINEELLREMLVSFVAWPRRMCPGP